MVSHLNIQDDSMEPSDTEAIDSFCEIDGSGDGECMALNPHAVRESNVVAKAEWFDVPSHLKHLYMPENSGARFGNYRLTLYDTKCLSAKGKRPFLIHTFLEWISTKANIEGTVERHVQLWNNFCTQYDEIRLQMRFTKIETSLRRADADRQSLRSRLNILEETVKKQDRLLEHYENTMADMKTTIDMLNSEIGDIEKSNKVRDSRINGIQDQMDVTSNTLDGFHTVLQMEGIERSKVKVEIKNIRELIELINKQDDLLRTLKRHKP